MDVKKMQQRLDEAGGPLAKLDRTHGEPIKVAEAKDFIESQLKTLPQTEDVEVMWHVLKVVMADSTIPHVARPKIK